MRFTAVLIGIVLMCGPAFADPYTFTWTGTVTQIFDQELSNATLTGVNIGDTLVASVTYDPDTFGAGAAGTLTDGLDYAAPAGLQMTYSFASGGVFTNDVTLARARHTPSYDQWNWLGRPGGDHLLFQLGDDSASSFSSSLPASFADMHDLLLSAIARFEPAGAYVALWGSSSSDYREVHIGDQSWSVGPAAVPLPGAVLLAGLGLSLAGWRLRRPAN